MMLVSKISTEHHILLDSSAVIFYIDIKTAVVLYIFTSVMINSSHAAILSILIYCNLIRGVKDHGYNTIVGERSNCHKEVKLMFWYFQASRNHFHFYILICCYFADILCSLSWVGFRTKQIPHWFRDKMCCHGNRQSLSDSYQEYYWCLL